MSSGIYCILCTANGKRYVGQSRNVQRRLIVHRSLLRRGVHFNVHLQAAYTKYESESFETSVLELCGEDMLDIRERAWIAYFHSTEREFGYNQESGGKLLKRQSSETKARISAAGRGRKLGPPSAEHRRRLSEALRGKPLSAEHCQRMSEAVRESPVALERCRRIGKANLGRKHTPEAKARMSDAQRQRAATPEDRARRSEVMKLYWAAKKAAATQPQIG